MRKQRRKEIRKAIVNHIKLNYALYIVAFLIIYSGSYVYVQISREVQSEKHISFKKNIQSVQIYDKEKTLDPQDIDVTGYIEFDDMSCYINKSTEIYLEFHFMLEDRYREYRKSVPGSLVSGEDIVVNAGYLNGVPVAESIYIQFEKSAKK